jgi:hypothetical protein
MLLSFHAAPLRNPVFGQGKGGGPFQQLRPSGLEKWLTARGGSGCRRKR